MAGGPIKLWNEWATQILVLLSITLQIFLFLFARTRRRGPSAMLKVLLWLAYLMADSIVVYTLGHLSINGLPREQKFAVFWAPFLLVHLGGQDTITAYALEDNQLWPRHLLNLGVQAFGVAYVLYKHIAEIPTFLRLATGLMFVIGLIKYGERILALKCATLDNIRSSINNNPVIPITYNKIPPWGLRAEEVDEEELLLFAQAMIPLCKGVMAGSPVALRSARTRTLSWTRNSKIIRRVVEMELSLLYDILYTKAAVIHNWYGYCIRVFSPLATIAAFILFQLSGTKDGYNSVNVVITYTLLVVAFILDMASIFNTLGSTRTCNILLTRGWSKLGNVIMSLRRLVKAAQGNRGWSGSIGQFNLLRLCSRDPTKLSSRVAEMIGLEEWWNKWQCVGTVVISGDAKDLVFQRVWHAMMQIHYDGGMFGPDYPPYEDHFIDFAWGSHFAPESYADTARRSAKLAQALSFSAELQELILTWHIVTDVFLFSSSNPEPDNSDATSSTCRKAIKALSNYMVFLIVIRPDTIPGLELRSLYHATRDVLQGIWSSCFTYGLPLEKMLVRKMHAAMPDARSNAIIVRVDFYINVLQNLADTGVPDKSDVISFYEDRNHVAMNQLKLLMPDLEFSCRGSALDVPKLLVLILDAWVHLLILASIRCNRDTHASQINCGGELTTVVRLMEQHVALFLKPRAEK